MLLLFLLPITSEAGTFSAFGPKVYQRGQGTPVTITDPFTVQTPATTYTLRITNGGLNNQFPLVTSATVTLNGTLIVRGSDFNGTVRMIEKPVTLTPSNTLVVQVTGGGPQAGFVVEIIGLDNTPPTITATVAPPANAAGWHNRPATVTFTCADALSGIATCPVAVVVNTDGANQVISGTAVDKAGNTATASVGLNLDRAPPSLQAVLTPGANAAGWNAQSVTVSFVASDAVSGVADTTPQATVTSEGANQPVPGTATDLAGNQATTTATVNLDLSNPHIAVVTPAAGALVRTASVAVSGSVNDAVSGVAAVTCNGAPGTVSGGGFQCVVPVEPGRNTVVARVQDRAGRSAQVQRIVVFQPGPAITITAPPSLFAFNRTPIAVTGTVSAAAVSVECNDVPAGLTNGGFGATVPLEEGNNIITCVARDASGQAGTASSTVTLDTMPPRVTIQTPSTGAILTSTPVTVTGMINDVVVGTVNVEEARVECNGVQARIANRAFVATPVPLTPGTNPIICTGIDRAGNVDTEQINVTVNTAALATITVVSGNNQTARIGTLLPEPLVVALTENGTPASGKPVEFRVLRNDGSLSTTSGSGRALTVMTDANGQAAVRFTLGTWAGEGNSQVAVTAAGFVGETIMSATATPGPPGLIVMDAGNNQEGVIGQPLPRPFVATVVDSGSNRLGGVPVTFTVKQGGGDFNGQPTLTVPTDSDGRAVAVLTLGPEEGIENNVVSATYAGNTGSRVTFVASGKLAGDPAQTRISGVVLDNSNNPIPGVTLHVEGTSLTVQSDAQGQFVLQPAPVGHVLVVVDGSTVAPRNGMPWPKLEYELVTVAGRDNTVGMPMYLLPIDTPRGILVDETHGGTLTLDELPGFSLTVVPGSATFSEGGKRGTVSVTLVHADKVPMVPNFGQQPRFIITIQPAGTHFNPPAALTMPNVDGMAPGKKTEMYSFDHDMGMFVSIGPATVSEDGLVVQSDPGVGVIKGGWHCGGDPSQPGGAEGTTVALEESDRVQVNGRDGEIVLAVGEKDVEVVAIGKPAPGKQPEGDEPLPFEWTNNDAITVSVSLPPVNATRADGEAELSRVKLEGKAVGETTVRVKYVCDEENEETAELTVKVVEPAIKQEKVKTVINANNSYSEDTTLKATVVFPEGHPRKGETMTDFIGDITFTEETGTAYYSTKGGKGAPQLPQTVTSVLGKAEITLQSLSNADVDLGPPSAKIRATANQVSSESATNPIEVDQWVDENGNGFLDWLEQHAYTILQQAHGVGGEVSVVTRGVTKIIQIPTVVKSEGTVCGAVRGITSPTVIGVAAVCPVGGAGIDNRHRVNEDRELSKTIVHEARHVWQNIQQNRTGEEGLVDDDPRPGHPDNDDDLDDWFEKVDLDSGARVTEAFKGTSDKVRNPGGFDNREDDADLFEGAHGSCCP